MAKDEDLQRKSQENLISDLRYPKVKDFLMHVGTGTKVLIKDDLNQFVYFEGVVKDYHHSDVSAENLTLILSYIENDTFIIMALKEYDDQCQN